MSTCIVPSNEVFRKNCNTNIVQLWPNMHLMDPYVFLTNFVVNDTCTCRLKVHYCMHTFLTHASVTGVQDLDKIIKDSDYAKLQQDWQDVSMMYHLI